jgi:hypothetical protein
MGETFDRVQKEVKRVPYVVEKGDNNTPVYVLMTGFIHHRKFLPWCSENEKNG